MPVSGQKPPPEPRLDVAVVAVVDWQTHLKPYVCDVVVPLLPWPSGLALSSVLGPSALGPGLVLGICPLLCFSSG
eukprot:5997234-Pyramimonas_sp.AAC.1